MTVPRATGREADRVTPVLLSEWTILPSNFGNGFIRGSRNCRISPPRLVRLRLKLKKPMTLSRLISISQSHLLGGFRKFLHRIAVNLSPAGGRPNLKPCQHPHQHCFFINAGVLQKLIGQGDTPLLVAGRTMRARGDKTENIASLVLPNRDRKS